MYPHYPHYWRRGPSRLLWFIVGAGAATWWHKHHEMHKHEWTWGHCRRAAIQNPPPNTPPSTDGSDANTSDSSFSLKNLPRSINNIPPAGWSWAERQEAEKYKEQQDHLADLRKQATDAMSDMTEATLESILSGAEALRAKLIASRELRKKQEEQLKREIAEQEKNPPRLI
ncbi:hypothetical protein D9756_002417 [Leucocoprinus leucothites]|uniref:Uncharacterized protein n=1 Tax=Leucocoprinus leucothites TaxID=201217 RepID=A0A8H5GCY4_9AGAR|nr:hypothetical protein D9756_002417 [Leucoagaricus leucothites]